MRQLQELESSSNTRIVYCVADISNLKNANVDQAYRVQFGECCSPIHAILPLLPGVPLMVTKNINRPLGKHPWSFTHSHIDLVNGKIVYFHGFVNCGCAGETTGGTY